MYTRGTLLQMGALKKLIFILQTCIFKTMIVAKQETINTQLAIFVGNLSHVIKMKKAPHTTEPVYPADNVTHLEPPTVRVTPPKFSLTFTRNQRHKSRHLRSLHLLATK